MKESCPYLQCCIKFLSLTVERVEGTKGWKSLSLEFLNYFSTIGEHWRQSCSNINFIRKFWLEISLLLKLAVRFARIKFWPQFSKKSKHAWVFLLNIRHIIQYLTEGGLRNLKCLVSLRKRALQAIAWPLSMCPQLLRSAVSS